MRRRRWTRTMVVDPDPPVKMLPYSLEITILCITARTATSASKLDCFVETYFDNVLHSTTTVTSEQRHQYSKTMSDSKSKSSKNNSRNIKLKGRCPGTTSTGLVIKPLQLLNAKMKISFVVLVKKGGNSNAGSNNNSSSSNVLAAAAGSAVLGRVDFTLAQVLGNRGKGMVYSEYTLASGSTASSSITASATGMSRYLHLGIELVEQKLFTVVRRKPSLKHSIGTIGCFQGSHNIYSNNTIGNGGDHLGERGNDDDFDDDDEGEEDDNSFDTTNSYSRDSNNNNSASDHNNLDSNSNLAAVIAASTSGGGRGSMTSISGNNSIEIATLSPRLKDKIIILSLLLGNDCNGLLEEIADMLIEAVYFINELDLLDIIDDINQMYKKSSEFSKLITLLQESDHPLKSVTLYPASHCDWCVYSKIISLSPASSSSSLENNNNTTGMIDGDCYIQRVALMNILNAELSHMQPVATREELRIAETASIYDSNKGIHNGGSSHHHHRQYYSTVSHRSRINSSIIYSPGDVVLTSSSAAAAARVYRITLHCISDSTSNCNAAVSSIGNNIGVATAHEISCNCFYDYLQVLKALSIIKYQSSASTSPSSATSSSVMMQADNEWQVTYYYPLLSHTNTNDCNKNNSGRVKTTTGSSSTSIAMKARLFIDWEANCIRLNIIDSKRAQQQLLLQMQSMAATTPTATATESQQSSSFLSSSTSFQENSLLSSSLLQASQQQQQQQQQLPLTTTMMTMFDPVPTIDFDEVCCCCHTTSFVIATIVSFLNIIVITNITIILLLLLRLNIMR